MCGAEGLARGLDVPVLTSFLVIPDLEPLINSYDIRSGPAHPLRNLRNRQIRFFQESFNPFNGFISRALSLRHGQLCNLIAVTVWSLEREYSREKTLFVGAIKSAAAQLIWEESSVSSATSDYTAIEIFDRITEESVENWGCLT